MQRHKSYREDRRSRAVDFRKQKKIIINRRVSRRNDPRLKARNFMPRHENLCGSFVLPIKKRHDIRREIPQGNEARLLRDAQRAAFPATRRDATRFVHFRFHLSRPVMLISFPLPSPFLLFSFPDCQR